jgi:hypothetical protein
MNNKEVIWYMKLEVIHVSFQLGGTYKSPMNKSWNHEVTNVGENTKCLCVCVNWTDTVFIVHDSKQIFRKFHPVPNS